MKYIYIFTVLLAVFFAPYNVKAINIIWLSDVSPTLKHGIKNLKNGLNDARYDVKKSILKLGNSRFNEYNIEYDDVKHKVYVNAEIYTKKKYNNKITCRQSINAIKQAVFGEDRGWALGEYFSEMSRDDLRYFLRIAVELDSYAVRNIRTSRFKELGSYSKGLPKNAVSVKFTRCYGNLLSDEIYFD